MRASVHRQATLCSTVIFVLTVSLINYKILKEVGGGHHGSTDANIQSEWQKVWLTVNETKRNSTKLHLLTSRWTQEEATATQHHVGWISSIYRCHMRGLYTPQHHPPTPPPPPQACVCPTEKTKTNRQTVEDVEVKRVFSVLHCLFHAWRKLSTDRRTDRGNDFLSRKCLLMIICISGQTVNSERRRPSGRTSPLWTSSARSGRVQNLIFNHKPKKFFLFVASTGKDEGHVKFEFDFSENSDSESEKKNFHTWPSSSFVLLSMDLQPT